MAILLLIVDIEPYFKRNSHQTNWKKNTKMLKVHRAFFITS